MTGIVNDSVVFLLLFDVSHFILSRSSSCDYRFESVL